MSVYSSNPTEAVRGGPVERVLHLRTVPILDSLDTEELSRVAEYTRERHFRRGETIFSEGRGLSAAYLIVEGTVALRRSGQAVGQAHARQTIGGLVLFAGVPSCHTASAETDVTALELRSEALLELFEDHFAIFVRVLRRYSTLLLAERERLGGNAGYRTDVTVGTSPPDAGLDVVERMLLLRVTLPFTASDLNSVVELARVAHELRVPKGSRLWSRGDAALHGVSILRGVVRCEARNDSCFRFGAGQSLGWLDSSSGIPRWYDATVEEDLVGLRVRTDHVYDILEDNFEVGLAFLRMVAGELYELSGACTPHGEEGSRG